MQLQFLSSRSLQSAVSFPGEGLRIAVLAADLPPVSRSGIGVSIAAECQALTQLGCSVRVFTASPQPLRLAGVSVSPLPRDKFPADMAACDILHLHSLALARFGLEASRRLNLPLVYTVHTLVEDELASAYEWVALQHHVLRSAHHVFFLNNAERERAIARLPSIAHRSSVRHHGIANEPCKPTHPCECDIIVPARICRNKGTDVAVAALRHLLQTGPAISTLFAGGRGDHDCETALATLITEFPGRVHRTGWLSHNVLMRSLARARIALFPSRYEPFGLLPLEALDRGTAVLSALSDGAYETLREAPGAALLRSHDPFVWADAIRQELHHNVLQAAVQAHGPAWVQRHFNPLQHAHLLLQQLTLIRRSHAAQVFCNVA